MDVLERVVVLVEDGRAEVGGVAPDSVIVEVESSVGRLPDDFRTFVSMFSWLRVAATEVFGVGDSRGGVSAVTAGERAAVPRLPAGLVVFAEVGDGDVYCVRTGVASSPVFLAIHDAPAGGRVLEEVAPSFNDWLSGEIDGAFVAPVTPTDWPELDEITEVALAGGVQVGKGASEEEIVAAEKLIGRFSGAYRQFLGRCGWMRWSWGGITGLGSDVPVELDVVQVTLDQRSRASAPLSSDLIVVVAALKGGIDCLPVATVETAFNQELVFVNREFYPDELKIEHYGDTFVATVKRHVLPIRI